MEKVNGGIYLRTEIVIIIYDQKNTLVLPLFQNVGRFDFSRFIVFIKYLDISYV